MTKQQLLRDRAGTLHYDVLVGRPTAATVTIKRPGGSDLPTAVDEATATIDTVNTTITDSDATADSITVASATGIEVGRTYLIRTAKGETSSPEVVGVDGTTVYLDDLPAFDLTSGDEFLGTRISYPLDATQTVTANLNYRASWIYTVNGSETLEHTAFDIVRSIPRNYATDGGFRRHAGALATEFELSVGESWGRPIEEGFNHVIRDVYARDGAPNAIIDWSQFETVVYDAVLLRLAQQSHVPPARSNDPAAYVEERAAIYAQALAGAMMSVSWYDEDQDLVVDEGESNTNRFFAVLRK